MTNKMTTRELLIRVDERQVEILKKMNNVEEHLERLNGQVGKNKDNIAKVFWLLILGSVIYIKESRDFLITLIKSLI